jgi:hypothetical protein
MSVGYAPVGKHAAHYGGRRSNSGNVPGSEEERFWGSVIIGVPLLSSGASGPRDLGEWSWRSGDPGRELSYRGERMSRADTPPPRHAVDERDGLVEDEVVR